ncbi:MAG: pH regulation protein F [Candidatus Eremiobacteraeota bacterium]|nr:pH regulation protein F [Candidatus Eremiobacteraeota bacterium]
MHKEALVIYGCILIAFMLPLLYRAVVGPTTIDRMIGVNIIGTKTTILLLIVGLIFERLDMFIDLALTYALLNFLASLAAARLLERMGISDDGSSGEKVVNGK